MNYSYFDFVIKLLNDYPTTVISVTFAIIILILIISLEMVRHFRDTEELKYEFITIMAHKFQTPLSQIKWLAENLIESESDQYKKESMSELKKSAENLISLTSTLIDMTDSDNTSKSAYDYEKIDICKLMKDVSDSMKSVYQEKNISFSLTCSQPSIFVFGDKTRIDFVIQSIINNAYKFSSVGHRIFAFVSVSGRKVSFSVRDEGIGISPTEINKVGTKFFRAKNSFEVDTEGFGVSLFLSDTIVRRHKGEITIASDGIGKGTTVTVVLPKAKN